MLPELFRRLHIGPSLLPSDCGGLLYSHHVGLTFPQTATKRGKEGFPQILRLGLAAVQNAGGKLVWQTTLPDAAMVKTPRRSPHSIDCQPWQARLTKSYLSVVVILIQTYNFQNIKSDVVRLAKPAREAFRSVFYPLLALSFGHRR